MRRTSPLCVPASIILALCACAGMAYLSLALAPALVRAAQGGPAAEPADKSGCTNTCSTCPGKAAAMLKLAEYKKVTLAVEGVKSEAQADKLHDALLALDGVMTGFTDLEQSTLWVAYDADVIGLAKITAAVSALQVKVLKTVDAVEPLPKLAKGFERCIVYVLLPADDAKAAGRVATALGEFDGIGAHAIDHGYNMLLVDYKATSTTPVGIRDLLLGLGFPAGLPGEEMSQPN